MIKKKKNLSSSKRGHSLAGNKEAKKKVVSKVFTKFQAKVKIE